MTTIIAWIIFGTGVVALIAWVLAQLLTEVFRRGYRQGLEDAGKRFADWESRAEQQVEQVRQEMKDERRGA